MTIGAVTIVDRAAAQGPIFYDRITVVGDDAYPAGGSLDFVAAFQLAIASTREVVGILADDDNGNILLQFVGSTGGLLARLISTGVESAVADQSGTTYKLTVISK
jgi:hypothetical protein